MIEIVGFWLTYGLLFAPPIVFILLLAEHFAIGYIRSVSDGRIIPKVAPLGFFVCKRFGLEATFYEGAYTGRRELRYHLDDLLMFIGITALACLTVWSCTAMVYFDTQEGANFLGSTIFAARVVNDFTMWPIIIGAVLFCSHVAIKKFISSALDIKDKIDTLTKETK